MKTTPWVASQRPTGKWTVDRVFNDELQRWGTYNTQAEAQREVTALRQFKVEDYVTFGTRCLACAIIGDKP